MAIKKKRLRKPGAKAAEEKSTKVETLRLSLPTQRSVAMPKLSDYIMFIYGEKKIGKTTMSAEFGETFHMMFEPGGRALELYQRPVQTWKEFLEYVRLLRGDGGRFENVVVDTADLMYKLCFDYMCKEKLFIEHPQDENDFGKSWGRIKDEFTRGCNMLARLNKGVIFISHARSEKIKKRGGSDYDTIQPTISGQGREVLNAMADVWIYYTYRDEKRVLYLRGDDHISAGTRLQNRFLYTDGSQIRRLVVEARPGNLNPARHASDRLIAAFNNQIQRQQTKTKTATAKKGN